MLPFMKQIISDARLLQEEISRLTGLFKDNGRISVTYVLYPGRAKAIASFQSEQPGIRFVDTLLPVFCIIYQRSISPVFSPFTQYALF
jgi:hypothetical protein